MNPNNQNDDDTITTAASSFVHIPSGMETQGHSGGAPLFVSIQPRHDTIGLDAVDATNNRTKYTLEQICVTISATATQDDDDERAPVDILVALDLSGSMQVRGKLDLCKKTLGTLVRLLQPQDRFGLITYATEARIALPLTRMSTAGYKQRCVDVIRGLRTRDATNISAALGLAAQEMHMVSSPNPVRAIFLLTDGMANEGVCQPEALQTLARNCLAGVAVGVAAAPPQVNVQDQQGGFMGWTVGFASAPPYAPPPPTQVSFTDQSQIPITLHTFGYGTNHNDSLLQKLAEVTQGGSYYFVEDDKGINTAFGDAMGGMVSVVAQNAVVHLSIPAAAVAMGAKIEKVHHDQALAREDGSYTVTVGDFYAEETRDVVVAVKLAIPAENRADSASIPHLAAKISYTDTLARRPVESGVVIASISRPYGTVVSEENDHVAAQWLRVFSVEQMAQAEAHAESCDFAAAQASLTAVSHAYHLQSPSVQAHGESASCFHSSLAMANDMSSGVEQYRAVGSKRARQMMSSHKYQRSAAMTTPRPAAMATAPPSPSPYETKSKKSWKSRFG